MEGFRRKEVFNMPRFDGTGPRGQGPMTGWGRGVCNTGEAYYEPSPSRQTGNWAQAYGPISGRGFGSPRGRRFGRGSGFTRGRSRGFGRGWF